MALSTCVDLVFSGAYRYTDVPAGHDPLEILIAEEDGEQIDGFAGHDEIMNTTGAYDGRTHSSQRR